MPKCQICQKNAAVIILTRIEGSRRVSEGICLKCALDKNIPGLDEAFNRSGITRENVDEIQEKINQMFETVGDEGPGMLLKALLENDVDLKDVLDNFDPDKIRDELDAHGQLTDATGPHPGELMNAATAHSGESQPAHPGTENRKSSRPLDRRRKYLEQFGSNLTEKARDGHIDAIVGREKELNRVIQILNRRSKNNPVLIGEPGVGKTAIAEGLALRIAQGQVPAKLLDREVIQLDMTGMVAGTQFRGQFEARMKGVVDDARAAGNVILVIDEIHNIMGAGDAEGAMNAANILKPALAQGEICVIGATTLDEYRRHIEKDSALERRFQKVIVEEPGESDTLKILEGVKGYYEKHHDVTYSKETLAAAVKLSSRYIQERYQPDKAIDLLDEAGSRVNLHNQILVRLKQKKDDLNGITSRKQEVEEKLHNVNSDEERNSLYAEDANLRSEELRLQNELDALEKQHHPIPITPEDIASVVEMWTGIPVKQITESESEKLLHLEERLHERVIGQDKAIHALAAAIRRKRAGFGKKDKPASFLFVGPTGVGKTELAKALAATLFEDEKALVRLDMSEFMEAHTVAKLIGSPPGYVGYDDGGQLTEKIRRHPYRVILFDEIEKAHPDVYNMLLQILDDGRLTDSHGRVTSFANTVIIMTSNAGTTLKANGIGFGQDQQLRMEDRVDTVLKEIFRPEFLNRIDETIVFESLTREDLRKIVNLMLQEVRESMDLAGFELELTGAARDALADKGYDPRFGARPLRKAIQKSIEEKLSDLLLGGDLAGKQGVKVGVRSNEFYFDPIEEEEL